MSSALAGRFLTTAPPEKPYSAFNEKHLSPSGIFPVKLILRTEDSITSNGIRITITLVLECVT